MLTKDGLKIYYLSNLISDGYFEIGKDKYKNELNVYRIS